MNTVEKGDRLEDQLYEFLLDQFRQGDLVFDVYPSALCEVYKKKKYFCAERGGDVEFDIVVEVRRKGRVRIHNQNITTAANAHADKKTLGHLS